MLNRVLSLWVALLLALPAFETAAAAPASGAQEQGSKWHQSDDSERVCTRERVAGSNIPKRVCRTRAQVEAQEEASRRQLREMQEAPVLNRPSPQ